MSSENERRILEKIRESGYPLEVEVVNQLLREKWAVQPQYSFVDKQTGKMRSIDILVTCFLPLMKIHEMPRIAIECEKSKEAWVFYCVNSVFRDPAEMGKIGINLLDIGALGTTSVSLFYVILEMEGRLSVGSVETVDTASAKENHYKKNQDWQINSADIIVTRSQVCELLQESKNLTETPRQELASREGTTQEANIKGKVIEYSFWLLKQGYAKTTIKGRTTLLKRLAKLGDITNPESIKEVIAKQEWSTGRKENAVDAYSSFLQMQNRKWEPPSYRRIRKLPFIPTENEVDQLIGGCNKRMATFLQLLKETGVGCGEACKLKWTDIDTENLSVRVTPEKGSNPRIHKMSAKLTSMLNALPKDSQALFPSDPDAMRKSYQRQRKQVAFKMQNPRLMQISFHTLRHYKATMKYHRTKNILHVMQILGHRSINNTLIYTHLVNFKDDDYTAKVAHPEQEVCQLIEAGFEFVCDYEENKVFRKRK